MWPLTYHFSLVAVVVSLAGGVRAASAPTASVISRCPGPPLAWTGDCRGGHALVRSRMIGLVELHCDIGPPDEYPCGKA